MSGSLSLIIILIVVVWAIVLVPMMVGDNKPIRRSGTGYEKTRVLHQGGSNPVAPRRRPRVTAADVRASDRERDRTDSDDAVTEALIDDTTAGSTALSKLLSRGSHKADEVVGGADDEFREMAAPFAQRPVDEQPEYDVDDSFLSPEDYGYFSSVPAAATPVAPTPAKELESVPDERVEADLDTAPEPTEEEVEFAKSRRGGWDPEATKRALAERNRRRQRTLVGLVLLVGAALVYGFVAGGGAWAAPVVTGALLVWYLVALRTVVKQERALHARRVQQLRRARLGVVHSDEDAPVPAHMRRPGAVIVELDDESADFSHLPAYEGDAGAFEYDDYVDVEPRDPVRESA